MQEAVSSAARTIAVLSPAYFGSRFGEAEWRAAFAKDPSGERGLLVPVRVQPCEPPGLLATRVYVDLVDLDEASARERLLAAVDPPAPRPTDAPFPGGPHDRATEVGDGGAGAVPGGGAGGEQSAGPEPQLLRPRRAAGAAARAGCRRRRSRRCCRWRRCTGWAGSARPSWRWSTRTGSAATTTSSGGSRPSSPPPRPRALAGLAGRLGVPAAADQAATVAGRCSTCCAAGTAGC